ncbi:FHA domain-containing protein [Cryobacterium glaciale]|uniref:FHA domain-containing protein n=1 Tax=Cryobacterium glaciale TaxID=1259145 RepID=A0A4R8V730_9MICO|nr:FHA domain-containing protein [Cryobacterium glaciale]TFB77331.1 FHA domain-containing protein [Cryobacterium glaciale]
MSAQCRFCDAPVKPNSMFCSACGQLVSQPVPSSARSAVPPPFGGNTASSRPPVVGSPRPMAAPAPVPLPPINTAAPGMAAGVPSPPATPGQPADPPAASAVAGPIAVARAVRFQSGQIVELTGGIIFGRKPSGKAVPAGFVGVVVPDDSRQVSRAHIAVDSRTSPPTVTDLGSANGSEIERAGHRQVLQAEAPVYLQPGDRLWLGSAAIDVL